MSTVSSGTEWKLVNISGFSVLCGLSVDLQEPRLREETGVF